MSQPKPWLDEIIEVLEELGGIASTRDIYNKVVERNNMDFQSNESIRQTITKYLELYSSDSKSKKTKWYPDKFYSVEGLRKGVWGLRDILHPPTSPDSVKIDPKYAKKIKLKIDRYIRDTKIARELKADYDNYCQICKSRIQFGKKLYYSEAHHVRPLGAGHHGPDIKENLIVLCPNHHVEFDYAVLAIEPKSLKILHTDIKSPFYDKKFYHIHQVSEEYLSYHVNNIFKSVI